MMRITDSFKYDLYKNIFSALKEKMDKNQAMVASGRKILTPSDDPAAFAKSMQIDAQKSMNDQYRKNLNSLKATGAYYETSVNTISDLLTKAKELALQMASDTVDATARKSAAEEIDGIIQQLAAVGNTKVGSTYIFGGKKSNIAPYNLDGNFSGTEEVTKVAVDSSNTMDGSISGSRIFTDGLDGGVDIFETLKGFRSHLSDNDLSGIQDDINKINACVDLTADSLSYVGVYTKRIETLLSANETRGLTLTETQSDLMDADTVQLITEFNTLTTAYQAAAYTMAKVQDLSLLNYLK
jgi:flagellar hook-associated protein 3 FlgL